VFAREVTGAVHRAEYATSGYFSGRRPSGNLGWRISITIVI
jgi:hypothetical protein